MDITDNSEISVVWSIYWNRGLPAGSKYWEDPLTVACKLGTQTILDTRLAWPTMETPPTYLEITPFSVDGILKGPPHRFIQYLYCVTPTTKTVLYNRQHGPTGNGLGCGSSYVPTIIHAVAVQEQHKCRPTQHLTKLAELVSFVQFHAT